MTPGSDTREESPSKARRALGIGLLVLLALGIIAGWLWDRGAEKRALLNLPSDQRRAVYARELENLHALCAGGPTKEAMAGRCQAQGDFLLEFPECDEACRALVDEQRPRATK
jgi:hypothetical protein